MLSTYTSYIDIVDKNSDVLTETISGDLTFFINKFIELGFVTRTATDDILSPHGVGNREKTRQLLSLLTAHYNRTRNKEKWFDKFVGVFSSEAAYEDLAIILREAVSRIKATTTLSLAPDHDGSHASSRKRKRHGPSGNRRDTKKQQLRRYTSGGKQMVAKGRGDRGSKGRKTDRSKSSSSLSEMKKRTSGCSIPSKAKGERHDKEKPDYNPSSSEFSSSEDEQSTSGERLPNQSVQSQVVGECTLTRGIQSQQIFPSSDPQRQPSSDLQQNLLSGKHPSPHTPQNLPPTHNPPQHLPQYSHGSHVINSTTQLMARFIDYVRTVYKRGSEVERDTKVVKWPRTPSKVFINLACIDRASVRRGDYDDITEAMVRDGNVDVVEGKKWQIDFSQIACGLPVTTLETVILVEGAPGVGKSTFAWEFCRRWERGEIAQQYQLVLLLRLRDERMSRAKSLRDLIYHSSESVCQAVVEELECSCGHKTLLILEGFDELPDTCRTPPSVFLDLIYGQLLPMATVMVTSRPWATSLLHEKCSHRIFQHIEILGFRSQQITSYIRSTLSESEAVGLEHYLKEHPQIRMCMYIPLNSAIVVTVYQESQAGTVCSLPTTRTELYTALARTLLLRYLRGHPEYESGTKPMKTFNDLPPVVYGRFTKLCKLAYSGIAGNSDRVQLIFSDLPSDFDSLGFMDSVTELYVTQGTVSSHNFLHLTFQEFLAAVHISTMSPSDQLEHFQRHEDGRYTVVLRFLAGLTKLTCFSKDTIKNIFTDTGRTGSPYSVGCDVDVTIDLVNWMFEAHSDDVISLLERNLVNIYSRSNNEYLSYYSVGYCIAHSQCQWVLSLGGEIGEEEVRMLVGGASTRHEASGRVVGLRGGWNDYMPLFISAEGLNMLFTQWKSVLHLHELHVNLPVPCDGITWPDLSGLRVLTLGISGEKNWRLDSLLPHLSLESLTITADDGYVVLEDCDAIGLHIKSTTCLEELCVTCYEGPITIDDKGMEVISKALSDNQSLPLERLELECHGTFTDTAADCLVQFITNTTTLQHLAIFWCTFSSHGLLALVQALHHNSTLQEKSLKLSVTVDGDNEAKDYAKLLVEYPYMVDNINWGCQEEYINNISDTGAVALAQALRDNSTLLWLDLSNNNISDGGAVALAQALHHNSTLNGLDLSNNNISDAGAVALAQALHHNSTLELLNLYGNDAIGKEGTHQLLQALTVNTSIESLILPRRCEEYATQCTQYTCNAVRFRILF